MLSDEDIVVDIKICATFEGVLLEQLHAAIPYMTVVRLPLDTRQHSYRQN